MASLIFSGVRIITLVNAILLRSSLSIRQKQQGRLEVDGRYVADRKSTRLNSSHLVISYAVFCLKKKNTNNGRRGFAGQHPQAAQSRPFDYVARSLVGEPCRRNTSLHQ